MCIFICRLYSIKQLHCMSTCENRQRIKVCKCFKFICLFHKHLQFTYFTFITFYEMLGRKICFYNILHFRSGQLRDFHSVCFTSDSKRETWIEAVFCLTEQRRFSCYSWCSIMRVLATWIWKHANCQYLVLKVQDECALLTTKK